MMTRFQRMMKIFFPLGLLLAGLTSCHESKYLTGNQALYAANKTEVRSSVPMTKKEQNQWREDMEGYLRPKLNGKTLGVRIKLWIYNIVGPTKKTRGLKHWLKFKVGEPPVLASPAILRNNADVLQSHLENKGFFHDTVIVTTFVKDKHLTATYTAEVGPRYTIRNINYPDDSDEVSNRIDTLQRRSLLKKGAFYDLETIKEERIRIDDRLKNRGFYYFNPDHLVVDLDTAVGNHEVDMFMRLKEEMPDPARAVYRINNVTVYAHYDNKSDTNRNHAYTTPEGYRIIDTAHYLKPNVFRKTLVIKPGDIYRVDDHNTSLSRLVSLGVFQFVKARFEPASAADTNNKLDVYYYLTPSQKKSLKFEVTALTRSDNTTGTEVSVTWRHRNLFRGAELLSAKVYGGLAGQTVSKDPNTGARKVVFTRRAGIDLNLYIPRIVAPFDLNTSGKFVPQTRIGAGYDVFEQSSQYTLTSSHASFGYQFKNRATSENGITVLGINYVRPTNINPEYQQRLDTVQNLAYAIQKQLIIGPSWNFNYNSVLDPRNARRPNNLWFNFNADFSNNLLGILSGADVNKTGKQKEIFGVPFAQYMRFEADFRHYLKFGKYSMLATRIDAGVGITYGNSTILPFVKAFFAGGTNDIRAFRARALGPGSYYAGDPNKDPTIPDQPGDVKMEFNVEYRAKLFGLVRWAIFTDWGNVWTLRGDSSRPGAVFTPHFLNDFAVGAGAGLRFDLTILVLRIDVAVPLRTPWKPVGSKWNFKSTTDISDMVLNLAIGYPF
ncbi:BamA/TamA family outer membrane protein [Puia sp.]|jgi:outer membrane protein assembly factor BamA|uniref:translocation and assembly module lipoprotein TamL n=1 Tax=Puia sp. TaxID=2045100 RepID=UPI002F3E92CB